MKTNGIAVRRIPGVAMLLIGVALATSAAQSHGAKAYQTGEIVQDFTLVTRRAWTNAAGRAFMPGSPMRLSDFAGSILFLKFFDAT